MIGHPWESWVACVTPEVVVGVTVLQVKARVGREPGAAVDEVNDEETVVILDGWLDVLVVPPPPSVLEAEVKEELDPEELISEEEDNGPPEFELEVALFEALTLAELEIEDFPVDELAGEELKDPFELLISEVRLDVEEELVKELVPDTLNEFEVSDPVEVVPLDPEDEDDCTVAVEFEDVKLESEIWADEEVELFVDVALCIVELLMAVEFDRVPVWAWAAVISAAVKTKDRDKKGIVSNDKGAKEG